MQFHKIGRSLLSTIHTQCDIIQVMLQVVNGRKKRFFFLIPRLTCKSIKKKKRNDVSWENWMHVFGSVFYFLIWNTFSWSFSSSESFLWYLSSSPSQTQWWNKHNVEDLAFIMDIVSFTKKDLMQQEYTLFIILHNNT